MILTRAIGAGLRACLVMALLALPSLMLPSASPGTSDVLALIAVVAAAITFSEYYVQFPSIFEFRYAPPYNRLRFSAVLVNVVLLCLLALSTISPDPTNLKVAAVGALIGNIIDFAYSPVRLIGLMLPSDATQAQVDLLRAAAGISYLSSLVMVAVFAIFMRLFHWPAGYGTFNVWVNLPNFDPTSGHDVVLQLQRDSRVNFMLGLSLPFMTPLFAMFGAAIFDPYLLVNPRSMVWTVAIWAFLPASLMMRAIALARIADMLSRRRVKLREVQGLQAA